LPTTIQVVKNGRSGHLIERLLFQKFQVLIFFEIFSL